MFSSTVSVNVKLLPDGGASVLVCEAMLLEHCGLKLEGGCVSQQGRLVSLLFTCSSVRRL